MIDEFRKAIREIEKRGMKYFSSIFIKEDGETS
jgi:hypothetical protein